ncbi:uncharacterized protein LOC62_05G007629 [Vanrija pseudolonga]|uniref:Ig-like domain-containing protein n=1 Tax=Vanrija pseudolonga TaxID=143232 RepID=A0AAF0YDU5_9TREE|nr:hypothetical protein LOC62_05G007629 [Vanrija pseudolonga]
MLSKTLLALALASVAAAAPAPAEPALAKLTCYAPKDCGGAPVFSSTYSAKDKITGYWVDSVSQNEGLGACIDFPADKVVASCRIEAYDPAYRCTFGGTWASNCYGTFAVGYADKSPNGEDQSCATGDAYLQMQGKRIYGGLLSCRKRA